MIDKTQLRTFTLVGACTKESRAKFDLINKFINSLVNRKVECYFENNDMKIKVTQDEYDTIIKSDILYKTLYAHKDDIEIER